MTSIIALLIVIVLLLIYISKSKKTYEQWKNSEVELIRKSIDSDYLLRYEQWKSEFEDKIRKDAVKKSQSVTIGKVTEHLIPFFPDFTYNPKDARFIGAPIDMIVFDGLNSNGEVEIVFLETKTGQSSLNSNERKVKSAVENKRVRWESINPQKDSK